MSALIINIDDKAKHEAVLARQLSAGVNIISLFAEERPAFSTAIKEITGKPFRAVPAFLFFGPDGDFIADHLGVGFDWATLNDMLAASESGIFGKDVAQAPASTPAAAPVTMPSREPAAVRNSIRNLRRYVTRGDFQRSGNWLKTLRTNYPDSHLVKLETARHIIASKRETNDSVLKYAIESEAAKEAENLLLSVLNEDPQNAEVSSVLTELYIINQQLDKATATMIKASDRYKSSHWANYNRAMYAFVRNRYAEATQQLAPVLQHTAGTSVSGSAWYRYQQAWKLAKRIGDADSNFDPIPVIKAGLVERVLEDEVMATLQDRIISDVPVMLIVNSEDPNCGHCVDVGSRIEPFVKDNKDNYQFLYVSIEPWKNIAYKPWMGAIPKLNGVPKSVVFARGRFMVSGGLPEKQQLAGYAKLYPRLQTENPGLFNFQKQAALGKRRAAQALWWAQKQKYSAFASVVSPSDYAWGSYDSSTGSQQEAERLAMQSCRKFAKEKGIKQECKITGRAEQ